MVKRCPGTLHKGGGWWRDVQVLYIEELDGGEVSRYFTEGRWMVESRLLHPQNLSGILSSLTPYRLPFDNLSEYPEPWLQQTRVSLSLSSPKISESQTWGEELEKTESTKSEDSFFAAFPPMSGTLFFQSGNVWTTLGQTSSCLLEPGFWILTKSVKRQPV